MAVAVLKQKMQDWITQQWVISLGERISHTDSKWLLGPFGNTTGIGKKYIEQLAHQEDLIIKKGSEPQGLLLSIDQLNLSKRDRNKLSPEIADFYENTSKYRFDLKVTWNPYFRFFGKLIELFFSKRIEQLNIPMDKNSDPKNLKSEIIHLQDPISDQTKRIIWLRTFESTGKVVYSGVYGTCNLPNGDTCIKAVFPLPNGNATVILVPSVGNNGELVLSSSGKKVGESGFYLLLKDSKGNFWTKHISSFKDQLIVKSQNGHLSAKQTLTLWNLRVLEFEYEMKRKSYCKLGTA